MAATLPTPGVAQALKARHATRRSGRSCGPVPFGGVAGLAAPSVAALGATPTDGYDSLGIERWPRLGAESRVWKRGGVAPGVGDWWVPGDGGYYGVGRHSAPGFAETPSSEPAIKWPRCRHGSLRAGSHGVEWHRRPDHRREPPCPDLVSSSQFSLLGCSLPVAEVTTAAAWPIPIAQEPAVIAPDGASPAPALGDPALDDPEPDTAAVPAAVSESVAPRA